MAYMKFKGLGISAMAAAVPSRIVENLKYTEFFPENQVKEVVEKKNSYETVTKSGVGMKRFRKIDLDKPVLSSRSVSMISLNGNPEAFINIVIEEKKKQISDLESKIAQEKNSIIKIKKEYAGIIENRILN